jgi:alcohol oxidase
VLILHFLEVPAICLPDGKRQDAAHCYIHPLIQDGQHLNLHLLLECKVIRAVFDNKSTPPGAVGVEYVPNPEYQPVTSLTQSQPQIIMARKLVVLSAGALGTTQILERSGVGNPVILNKLKIPIVSDLPGVGENCQDHQLSSYPYKTSLDDGGTLDCIFSGRLDMEKALVDKNPILGWNGVGVSLSPKIYGYR